MRSLIALAAAVLTAWVVMTGCGSESGSGESSGGDVTGSGGSAVEHDEELASTVVAMSKQGETRQLSELTDFEWDKVYLYSEGAHAKDVAEDVGSDVLSDEYYYDAGNLLVFTRDGELERAVSVVPDLLTWDGANGFGPKVTLTPAHAGENRLLRVQEPTG